MVDRRVPTKIVAACFAATAFSIALMGGLVSGRPLSDILMRAVIALFVCYPIGLIIGAVANRAVAEHVEKFEEKHPIPDINGSTKLPEVGGVVDAEIEQGEAVAA